MTASNQPFLERLNGGPLLIDGAMGTMLNALGAGMDECFDLLNLTQPQLVGDVHRAYIVAGADIIETNTWGANRFKLEQFGQAEQVRKINRKAVSLAREQREVTGAAVLVAGSVGPIGRTLEPIGNVAAAAVRDAFQEQIEALLEGGVDLISIETISGLDELNLALEAAELASDLPVIAMMTFAEDGRSVAGNSVLDFVLAMQGRQIAALGVNCSVGPRRILNVASRIVRSVSDFDREMPVACMPNAGWPSHVGGRVMYPSTPEYFGSFALEAINSGVRIVGGCCGTTPEHIAAMRKSIEGRSSEGATRPLVPARTSIQFSTIEVQAAAEPTTFARKLGQKFVTAVEIDPPKGLNPEKALAGARMLKEVGVDAINVADSPMARVRMSAMTLSYLIQHTVGVETIIHFTTRDRSLMGLQSELLGAHAAGIRNVLALTGDPPSLGDYPDSTAVYDIDSIGLLRVISRMNQGEDSAGSAIGQLASFTAGCAVDPTRADLATEASRLREKLAAGASFVMTQPIYDVAVWNRFLKVFGEIEVPVLVGILPLQSTRHAEFLHNEVPGINLTDDARERMRLAGPAGREEGIRMAQELLLQLREQAQGVYLMPSFGRYEVVAEVLSALPAAVV